MTIGETLTPWTERASRLRPDGRSLIGGERTSALSGRTRPTTNPATGSALAELAACGAEDVDRAVAAARRAQPAWAAMGAEGRKEALLGWAAVLEQHSMELALLESLDSGRPVLQTSTVDVPGAISCLRWYAEAADKLAGELPAVPPGAVAQVSREPLGVVAAIVPWNFPLEIAAWKLGPALASGNTVVLKPAEQTSLSTLRAAELAVEAGLPAGVLNVVTGSGREVGTALAHHMDVDALAFTGSTGVSRTLLEASGRSNLKRLSLEAGARARTSSLPIPATSRRPPRRQRSAPTTTTARSARRTPASWSSGPSTTTSCSSWPRRRRATGRPTRSRGLQGTGP
ncbi:hypothetical protein GCM10023081_19120 [Arthrobacter ginkgonis]|uniref:Aldehyde dehydrogenase domain-containing protein n=1 Tax=Arthrobacter ginkgonis TaxID=1630594 RepID=A0ABP7C655_9MICC